MKKSVIKGHIASKKYSANKEKLAKAKKREMDIAEVLDKFEKEHPRGETLPTGTRVYRVKIVQAFLKSGTPLNSTAVQLWAPSMSPACVYIFP